MERVLERIWECASLPKLWPVMIEYFREMGFGAIGYRIFGLADSGPPSARGSIPLNHGFAPVVSEAYINADFDRLDVVARLTLAQAVPMRWSDIWSRTDVNDEERRFVVLMRTLGAGDGISFPCYGPHGRNGIFGVGVMVPDAATDELSIAHMHMVAQMAHLRICALTPGEWSRDKPLSIREREILDWVARGKSNSVIAEILHISVGTVDTYLRRIYDKLGVSDRTSAAVRGIGMGLIAA